MRSINRYSTPMEVRKTKAAPMSMKNGKAGNTNTLVTTDKKEIVWK
jgi:hypothetical protein